MPQQLDSLAGLHARIRLGQPASSSSVCVQRDVLELQDCHGLNVSASRLSPDGTCAAIFYWPRSARGPGLVIVGLGADGVEWQQRLQPSVPSMSHDACFSQCGTYCAVISEPLQPTTGLELSACVFNMRTRSWGQDRSIAIAGPSASPRRRLSRLSMSSSAPLLSAVLQLEPRMLVVFSLADGSLPVSLAVPETCAFQWVPSSHAVVLLTASRLGRVDLSSQAILSARPGLACRGSGCLLLVVVTLTPQWQWGRRAAACGW